MGSPLVNLANLTNLDAGVPSDAGATLPVTILVPTQAIGQSKGSVRRYACPFVDPATQSPELGTFAGTELLRAYVWEGGDGPTLAAPAASWASASPPYVYLDVMPVDLAGLEEQPYPVRIEVDRGGQWQTGFEFWVDVEPEPATAAALAVYGPYSDMVRYTGNAIRQLLTSDQRAGFADARAEARRWLDRVIIARFRPAGGRYAWGVAGFGNALAGNMAWNTLDTPNPQIKAYLDADLLILDDTVREIVARKAASIVFNRQADADWRQMAYVESMNAENLTACLVAQIDVDGDGYPEITVNCGLFNTRDV